MAIYIIRSEQTGHLETWRFPSTASKAWIIVTLAFGFIQGFICRKVLCPFIPNADALTMG